MSRQQLSTPHRRRHVVHRPYTPKHQTMDWRQWPHQVLQFPPTALGRTHNTSHRECSPVRTCRPQDCNGRHESTADSPHHAHLRRSCRSGSHDGKRAPDGASAPVESVGQAGGAWEDTRSGLRDELFSIQFMLYFTLREQRHGPIKRRRVEKTCRWSVSDAFRVAGWTRTEPGSTLAPLPSTVSTRLVSLSECAPQCPVAPCPHRLLRYVITAAGTDVA